MKLLLHLLEKVELDEVEVSEATPLVT